MPPRMARSVVCPMRKCQVRFNDKESLLKHIDDEKYHKKLVFKGKNFPAPLCPWKRCKVRCHEAETFLDHFLICHWNLLKIRARPIVRRKRKRLEKCDKCWRKFATRLDVLAHHRRCHQDSIPNDQDESWPDLIWVEKEVEKQQ